MKRFNAILSALIVTLIFPSTAFAVDDALSRFINKVIENILQPIVWLLFALAMYYFVNGVATFMLKADDPKARATGRQHIIWGVVGFFIMVSVGFILSILTNTFGVTLPQNTITPR